MKMAKLNSYKIKNVAFRQGDRLGDYAGVVEHQVGKEYSIKRLKSASGFVDLQAARPGDVVLFMWIVRESGGNIEQGSVIWKILEINANQVTYELHSCFDDALEPTPVSSQDFMDRNKDAIEGDPGSPLTFGSAEATGAPR